MKPEVTISLQEYNELIQHRLDSTKRIRDLEGIIDTEHLKGHIRVSLGSTNPYHFEPGFYNLDHRLTFQTQYPVVDYYTKKDDIIAAVNHHFEQALKSGESRVSQLATKVDDLSTVLQEVGDLFHRGTWISKAEKQSMAAKITKVVEVLND